MKGYKCHIAIKMMIYMAFSLSPCLLFSQNDTIMLKNNDRLIGEIKSMKKGVMTIETDYSDTDFKVELINIIEIRSDRTFLVKLSNGNIMNTTIAPKPKDPSHVIISDAGKEIVVAIKEIVILQPVNDKFFSRFTSSLSFGYNYTKSSDLSQLTVRSTLGYTASYWSFSGTYNSVHSSQDDSEAIQRTDANAEFRYYLEKNWYGLVSGEFLSNEEQKLQLRSTLRTGIGKYLFSTHRNYLGTGAGLAWNNESFNDSLGTNRNSLEAFVTMELSLFEYKDISMQTKATVYPSITVSNRVRTDFNIDFKLDLPLNFFLKLGLTYNYDSKPVQDAGKEDHVIQTTFGWEIK
jgi:hypothetical protein